MSSWQFLQRKLFGLAGGVLFCLLCLGSWPVFAQPALGVQPLATAKNILFLYSYGHGSKGLAVFDEAFVGRLTAGGVNVNNIFFEYLDLERHRADPHYRQRLNEHLIQKHARRRFDLVLTGQQPALNFLLNEGRDIAPGVPAITVQAPMPSEAEAGQRRFVSQLAQFDIKGTLEGALNLFPVTRHVLIVAGNSDADRKIAAEAMRLAESWPGRLTFENTVDLPVEKMLEHVAHLPQHTVSCSRNTTVISTAA